MHFTSIFAQAVLATSAMAQLATITSAITSVQDALGELGTAVDGLSATDPNSAAPILTASEKVKTTIQSATQQVQGAEALGLGDALSLRDTAGGLVTSVQSTISSLTAKKADLDTLGVTSIAVQTLQQQQTDSKALSTAIVSKVPAIGKGIAEQSTTQIDTTIKQGIATLSAGGAAGGAGAGAGAGNATAPAARPAARVRRYMPVMLETN